MYSEQKQAIEILREALVNVEATEPGKPAYHSSNYRVAWHAVASCQSAAASFVSSYVASAKPLAERAAIITGTQPGEWTPQRVCARAMRSESPDPVCCNGASAAIIAHAAIQKAADLIESIKLEAKP